MSHTIKITMKNENQKTAFFGMLMTTLKYLFYVTAIIIAVVLTVSYFFLSMIIELPIIGGLIKAACTINSAATLEIAMGAIEAASMFAPPVAFVVVPMFKIVEAFAFSCLMLDSNMPFYTKAPSIIVGLFAMIPIVGLPFKALKRYM